MQVAHEHPRQVVCAVPICFAEPLQVRGMAARAEPESAGSTSRTSANSQPHLQTAAVRGHGSQHLLALALTAVMRVVPEQCVLASELLRTQAPGLLRRLRKRLEIAGQVRHGHYGPASVQQVQEALGTPVAIPIGGAGEGAVQQFIG
jgi:hypothetical protein